MRLSPLSLCLIPLLLVACSTVRVTPSPTAPTVTAPGQLPPMVRGDRADTAGFPPGDSDGYRPPERLAVLLPMSGGLAAPAAGVRDGFLAAYYGETRRRPIVKFYDSLGTGSGAQAALARALADGAQLVVGPLSRDEVNAVNGQGGNVPIIALNRPAQAPARGSISFALLPDDEGTAAAARLLARGQRQVLVFSNRSDAAQRSVAAFRATLRQGGGDIVAEFPATGDSADLGTQLSALMAGPKPPQAVYFALEAGPARAIAAQLKISALAGLPKISSSQILSGSNARADVELDGVEYPELPWLTGQGGGLPDVGALRSLPSARGPSQRLFAFGADAWKLAAYYERLYNEPAFSVRGATGDLRVDIAGPVQRTPSWAVFSGGRGRASH
jgi:outer membrane PBP1 activator LpoA protein